MNHPKTSKVTIIVSLVLLISLMNLGNFSIVEASENQVEIQEEMLEAINEARAEGVTDNDGVWHPPVPPLRWNEKLEAAALRHSEDMYENNFMDHTGSDGSSPWERIEEAGYTFQIASENVAKGHTSVEAVMSDLLGSPAHCANIMNEDVIEVGAARVGDSWTQVFALPESFDSSHTVTFMDYDGTEIEKQIVEHGSDAELPDDPEREGHEFIGWDGDHENIIEDTVLTAEYEIKEYEIELSAEPEDGGEVDGVGTYEYGEEVTVEATPLEGWRFVNWIEDGQEVSANAEYSFEITEDRELVANFVLPKRIETGRLSGEGRFDTAVDISENTYGDGEADAVVLATGLDFPDALAGVPLAYAKGGPLLLTRSDELPDETAHEIDRVLTEGDNVYVLGGDAAVSEDVEEELKAMEYEVERLSGQGRFDTAVKIAEEVTGSPEEVFLTTGLDFADAVAASSPAAMRGAPILLTHTNELSEDTADYLEGNETSIEDIHIIGGEAAVEDDVMEEASGTNRVSGDNRWETGTAIAEEFFEEPVKATLATGMEFPDALAGGVYAALNNAPVLLSASDELPDEVKDYFIGEEGIMEVSVFGGDGAVDDSVLRAIEAIE